MSFKGPFGGPRPLLDFKCSFTLEVFGGGPDSKNALLYSSDEFNQQIDVVDSGESFHELYPDTAWVELSNERVPIGILLEYVMMTDNYLDERVQADAYILSASILPETVLPRPLAGSKKIAEQIVLEFEFSKTHMGSDVKYYMNQLTANFDDVQDWHRPEERNSNGEKGNSVLAVTSSDSISAATLDDIMSFLTSEMDADLTRSVVTCTVYEY